MQSAHIPAAIEQVSAVRPRSHSLGNCPELVSKVCAIGRGNGKDAAKLVPSNNFKPCRHLRQAPPRTHGAPDRGLLIGQSGACAMAPRGAWRSCAYEALVLPALRHAAARPTASDAAAFGTTPWMSEVPSASRNAGFAVRVAGMRGGRHAGDRLHSRYFWVEAKIQKGYRAPGSRSRRAIRFKSTRFAAN